MTRPARFWPLGAGRVVTSGFGPRWGTTHWGTDFGRDGGSAGMPVYAAQAGTVIHSGTASGFGQWVVIDHPTEAGSGTTVYGHVIPEVRAGQTVHAGQRIAHINGDQKTNGGVAPHLHFEVHKDIYRPPGPGRIDPLPWLAAALEPGTVPAKGPAAVQSPITRTDLTGNHHGGDRRVSWVAIHTQEGRGTARDIIAYLKNPAPGGDPGRAVSYNAVCDDRESVLVVPWDRNPWSAVNANNRADHILMAGTFADWSRGKWLERDASDGVDEDMMLTRTAALVAWRCTVRGLPIEYVGGTGTYPPDRPGVCGHADFGAWGGGHTDPGKNFPWDELIRRARAFAEGEDDMASAEEIAKAVWAAKVAKPDGTTEQAGILLGWVDQHTGDGLDQLAGPGTKDQRTGKAGPLRPTGWPQMAAPDGKPRSLVDGAATKADLAAVRAELAEIKALLEGLKS